MKYYSILTRTREEWTQLSQALELTDTDYQWVGVFNTPTGAYNAIRAMLTEEQVIVLKLRVSSLEINEVFI